jgi:hypothetical protein
LGNPVKAFSYFTYGPDGKCIQVWTDTSDISSLVGTSNAASKCTGYPLWIVCKEMLANLTPVRNETVKIRGTPMPVKVYSTEYFDLWVGDDPPILYKYYVADPATNKSFSVELLDVSWGAQ